MNELPAKAAKVADEITELLGGERSAGQTVSPAWSAESC